MSRRARYAWAIGGALVVVAAVVIIILVAGHGGQTGTKQPTGPGGKAKFTRIGFSTNCSYVGTVSLEQNGPAFAQYGTRGAVPLPTSSPTGPPHHKRTACLFARYDPGVYYVSTLLQNGSRVTPPGAVYAYYVRPPGAPTGSEVTFPAGMKMVATHYYFTCSHEHKPASPHPFDCRASQPTSPQVAAWMNFPTCWDGTGTEPSDVRYASGVTCPSGFGKWLPLIQLQMTWRIADLTGATFSTGASFQASFENFWVPDALDSLVTNCITNQNPCGAIVNYFHRTPLPS